jgi:hypothetical protein
MELLSRQGEVYLEQRASSAKVIQLCLEGGGLLAPFRIAGYR